MNRIATLAIAIALGTACSTGSAPNEYGDVLPDSRLLVTLPSDFSSNARANEGELAEYYVLTSDVTHDINTLIETVLTGVGFITDFDPTWSDEGADIALWGPWEDSGLNGRLWVERHDDDSYAWAYEAKFVADGEDAWVPVFAGEIDSGATPNTSAGALAIDFTALASFDPTEDLTGSFYVQYSMDGDVVDATAGIEGLTDAESGEVIEAAYYQYGMHPDGGHMDLAVAIDATGNTTPEAHIVRTRWMHTGEGRADAYLTDGDLGALVYTATECWDTSQTVVFWEENYSLGTSGDASACAFGEPEFNESEDAPAAR